MEERQHESRTTRLKGDEEATAHKRSQSEKYTSSTEDKTRHELESAKEFAEMIVNTIHDALLVLDLSLRVKSANKSFYDLFRTSPDETEGRPIYELGNGQWDIPKLRTLLEEILPDNDSFIDFEVEHEVLDIGRRIMLLNARRLDNHQMILLAIEDVTERRLGERRLRESQERFDLLVENAREYAIFLMDEDTKITMWNPGAERILQWTEDEILGRTGDIIFTPEDREAQVPEMELAKARKDGSARDDRWHIRKDASRFWATGFMVGLRAENGEARGYAKILRDDTEKKEHEEERERLLEKLRHEQAELKRLNEELEVRVLERTRQVRSLASTLTMAEQQERRRISHILHDDLQQLLYGIQMKMMLSRRSVESGEGKDRLLEHLRESEEWLKAAVSTTRNLTVDLSPPLLSGEGLADALGWLATQMAELHHIEVKVKADHAFCMEDQDLRVLLFQIVRELLFNVKKHAAVDSATVELRQLDGDVMIQVSDDGQGFGVAEAERLFERGGGFGLFSVRERLNLFGGRMEIESAPGEGTRVTVYTPSVLTTAAEDPSPGEGGEETDE